MKPRSGQRRSWRRWFVPAALLALVSVNALAWVHAGAMMRWDEGGTRTARPEELGVLEKLRVLATGVSIPRPENRASPADIGLAYETIAFSNGRGEELEAWYVQGKGGPLLSILFHGYCGQKDSMLGVARGLADQGSRVLLVDFYGSGGSTGTGTTIGLLEAFDVQATVAEARARWPECQLLLYGQSMGGAALLRAVARLGVTPDAIVVESTFDRFHATVSSRFHRMGLPATPLAELLMFWGGVRSGQEVFDHDPATYAGAVRCPALVLQGANDPNVSSDQARAIHDQLGGWRRLELVPKTEHVDIRAAAPERWNEAVGALLAALE